MRRLINPVPAGGAPINNEQLNDIFQIEIHDCIEALLSPFDADVQGVIVSGCVITGGGPYAISAGVVYLNGEFMRLPAATGQTLPKYIAAKAISYVTKTFADQVTKNLIEVKEAELLGAAPGAGQYVAITTTTDPDDRRLINIFTNKQIATAFQSTLSAVGAVLSQATGEFQGGVRTASSGLYLKEKILDIVDWNMNVSVAGSITKTVAHGLDYTKIITAVAYIIDDAGTGRQPLMRLNDNVAGNISGSVVSWGATDISMQVLTGGDFDTAAYDSVAGYVRGKIIVKYEV